jgi:hypothetical protein
MQPVFWCKYHPQAGLSLSGEYGRGWREGRITARKIGAEPNVSTIKRSELSDDELVNTKNHRINYIRYMTDVKR